MKIILCWCAVLFSALLAATGATNEQINAIVFSGDHVESIYTGLKGATSNDRPAWGEVRFTAGWNRVYFAQLADGQIFRTFGPATNPVCWDLYLEGWTKTSYRMATSWSVGASPGYVQSNMYMSGSEVVWTFVESK